MKSALAVAMILLAGPVLADCVSCGPGGDCSSVSPGFSGNSEDGEFTEVSAPRIRISMRFLNDFAEVNPLLAGAVWAGIGEASSIRKGDRAVVQGTMGQDGRSYTYRTEVRILPKGSASFSIEVQEDGVPHAQRYEGTLTRTGRSGHFVQVGPKGRTPVFSWGAR